MHEHMLDELAAGFATEPLPDSRYRWKLPSIFSNFLATWNFDTGPRDRNFTRSA